MSRKGMTPSMIYKSLLYEIDWWLTNAWEPTKTIRFVNLWAPVYKKCNGVQAMGDFTHDVALLASLCSLFAVCNFFSRVFCTFEVYLVVSRCLSSFSMLLFICKAENITLDNWILVAMMVIMRKVLIVFGLAFILRWWWIGIIFHLNMSRATAVLLPGRNSL